MLELLLFFDLGCIDIMTVSFDIAQMFEKNCVHQDFTAILHFVRLTTTIVLALLKFCGLGESESDTFQVPYPQWEETCFNGNSVKV